MRFIWVRQQLNRSIRSNVGKYGMEIRTTNNINFDLWLNSLTRIRSYYCTIEQKPICEANDDKVYTHAQHSGWIIFSLLFNVDMCVHVNLNSTIDLFVMTVPVLYAHCYIEFLLDAFHSPSVWAKTNHTISMKSK